MARPVGIPDRWPIVVVGFVALALAYSVRNTIGLVIPGMSAELGWSRSVLSLGASLALLFMGAGSLLGGVVLDRFGARRVLLAGLALCGVGAILAGFAVAPWQYLVAFGGIAGAGFGLLGGTVVSTSVAHHFEARRGFAIGVTSSGSTAGVVLFIPLAGLIVSTWGWRPALITAGALCLAFIPLAAAALGRIDGVTGPRRGGATIAGDVRALFRLPVFHLLLWTYVVCGFTSNGVIETHFLPYAAWCGFSPVTAANAFGVLSVLNFVGLILAGWLSDRMSMPLLLGLIYLLRAVTFILLMNVGFDLNRLFLFAAIFGLFDYATLPVVAGIVARWIGVHVMGLALGLCALGHQVGAGLGALGGGVVFDLYNSYAGLWVLSLVLAVAAGAVSFIIAAMPVRTGASASASA